MQVACGPVVVVGTSWGSFLLCLRRTWQLGMSIYGGDFFRTCAKASGLGSRRYWRVPAVAKRVEEVVEATWSRWRQHEAGGGVSCVVF